MKLELIFIISGVLLFCILILFNIRRNNKQNKKNLDTKSLSASITPEPEVKKVSNIILTKQKYEEELKQRIKKEIDEEEKREEKDFNSRFGKQEEDNKTNSDKKKNIIKNNINLDSLSDEEKVILLSDILKNKLDY